MRYPEGLVGRERAWADLVDLLHHPDPHLRLGLVTGRRRVGKSLLLRRLVQAADGLYALALEQERRPALQRFADALARRVDLPSGRLRFDDWGEALRAVGQMVPGRGPLLVVLDELPYLLRHSPELPSVLQELYDERLDGPGSARPLRLVVCGSALSVMTQLLSGQQALRGRVALELVLHPFDSRQARRFWGAEDLQVALHLDAVLGGTPGHRDLAGREAPSSPAGLAEFMASTVLNPSSALFRESEYLLREDPRVSDRALYQSVLGAVSGGARTPAEISRLLGRPDRSLAHPLDVLLTAGLLRRDDDVLLQRRPILRLTDPLVRFEQVVVRPRLAALEDGRAEEVWAAAQPTLADQVLGPHVEDLARWWVRTQASEATTGGPVGEVGQAVVQDRAGRAQRQVDVVALAAGQRRQDRRATVRVLGEVKASARPRGLRDLGDLDRSRDLLVARGVDAADARLLLVSRGGADDDLRRAAAARQDVELVDLERLYEGC